MEALINKLGKYKYLLLVLIVGLLLILTPTRSGGGGLAYSATASDSEARLEEVLGRIDGVGETSVLYSDEGVVVVCEGAASPQVRLYVTEAVRSYTGLGSDRIRVLVMKATD